MTLLDLDRPSTPIARLLSLVESRVPERIAAVVAQARRDAAVVEGRLLRGAKPSPVVNRRSSYRSEPTPSVATPTPVATPAAPAAKPAKALAQVTIEDGDTTHRLELAPDRFLLEAALEQGAPMPFSCTLGGCGSCKVTLLEGAIDVEEPHCLTPDELDDGLRLTCVGRVTSSVCRIRIERDPS